MLNFVTNQMKQDCYTETPDRSALYEKLVPIAFTGQWMGMTTGSATATTTGGPLPFPAEASLIVAKNGN